MKNRWCAGIIGDKFGKRRQEPENEADLRGFIQGGDNLSLLCTDLWGSCMEQGIGDMRLETGRLVRGIC